MADGLISEARFQEPCLNSSVNSSPYKLILNGRETIATLSNYLQIAWTGDFLSLKQFVNETLKLEGTSTISWWKNRKDLQFKGTDAGLFKRTVCLIMKGSGSVNNKGTNTVIGPATCLSKCDELATDIEGIKLDQVVNERYLR